MNAITEEILISRLVQSTALPADWSELASLAKADPAVWTRLQQAQTDQDELCHAVNLAIDAADQIELPDRSIRIESARQQERSLLSFGGWAVAALLALAWSIGQFWTATTTQSNSNGVMIGNHALPAEGSLDDILSRYVNKGKESGAVLGELPEKVLLDAQPLPDGSGYELLYLRQLLERTRVPDLYEFGAQDESGRPALVKYDPDIGQSL